MERKVYSYREALEIVEEFMIESGIRKYCTTVCKGYCCGLCSFSENACFRNEGRRLPCSTFICDWLLGYLPNEKELIKINKIIERTLFNIMGKNPYFYPNTPDVQRKFSINKEIIDKIKSFNIKEYRRITNFLIEGKIKRIL